MIDIRGQLCEGTTTQTDRSKAVKITYSIWQGSRLLSIDNNATSPKEIDALITALNDSELGKKTKFTANVQTIQANN
jgi:hypothetical protein